MTWPPRGTIWWARYHPTPTACHAVKQLEYTTVWLIHFTFMLYISWIHEYKWLYGWFSWQVNRFKHTSCLISCLILTVRCNFQDVLQKLLKDPVIQECRQKSADGALDGLVTGQMTSKQALQVLQWFSPFALNRFIISSSMFDDFLNELWNWLSPRGFAPCLLYSAVCKGWWPYKSYVGSLDISDSYSCPQLLMSLGARSWLGSWWLLSVMFVLVNFVGDFVEPDSFSSSYEGVMVAGVWCVSHISFIVTSWLW